MGVTSTVKIALERTWMRVLRKFGMTHCSVGDTIRTGNLTVVEWAYTSKKESWDTYKALDAAAHTTRRCIVDWIVENNAQFDWDEYRTWLYRNGLPGSGRGIDIIDGNCQGGKHRLGKSAIVEAAGRGQLEYVKLVHCWANAYNVKSAVAKAAANGRCEVVKFLLEAYTYQKYNFRSAVKEAAKSGQMDTLRLLLHTMNAKQESVLVQALESGSENGRLQVMEFLHNFASADRVDKCSIYKMSDVLMKAAEAGQRDAVKYLLCETPMAPRVFDVIEKTYHTHRPVVKFLCSCCNLSDLVVVVKRAIESNSHVNVIESVHETCSTVKFEKILRLFRYDTKKSDYFPASACTLGLNEYYLIGGFSLSFLVFWRAHSLPSFLQEFLRGPPS